MSRASTEGDSLEEGHDVAVRSPPGVKKSWNKAVQAAEMRDHRTMGGEDSSEFYFKGDPELVNTEQTAASNEAGETRILDLSPYGKTVEQAAERLVEQNDKVLIFEKTWCLFSRDAKSFLVQQMGVSIVSIPLDLLKDQGEATKLEQYMKRRTRHRTVPIIFIKQEFLGGFEEVNALYSIGRLQDEYLAGLTQADRCEMEVRAAKSALKPLFWFPEKVNANQIRITGVLTCISSIVSVLAAVVWEKDWGVYMALGIFGDFALRILAGGKLSPLGRMAQVFALLIEEPKMRVGRPKQFAACCGFLFCFFGSLGYLIPFPGHIYVGAGFYAGLALASGMEGFLDFCLGCVFFREGINLGLIPK